jgi:REP element-mobilizing transposase RayT
MAVRLLQTDKDGLFFITFTCKGWLPLFEITNSYDLVYKWFDYLKTKGHAITGFVIMPNHLHILVALRHTDKSINTIVSNAKRFMAYEIIKRLLNQDRNDILQQLAHAVTASDSKRGKLH